MKLRLIFILTGYRIQLNPLLYPNADSGIVTSNNCFYAAASLNDRCKRFFKIRLALSRKITLHSKGLGGRMECNIGQYAIVLTHSEMPYFLCIFIKED